MTNKTDKLNHSEQDKVNNNSSSKEKVLLSVLKHSKDEFILSVLNGTYEPPQMSESDIYNFFSKEAPYNSSMGELMRLLKVHKGGSYDAKLAKDLAVEYLRDTKVFK